MTDPTLRSRWSLARFLLLSAASAAMVGGVLGCSSRDHGSSVGDMPGSSAGTTSSIGGDSSAGTGGLGALVGGAGGTVGTGPDLNVNDMDASSNGAASGSGGSPEVCDGIDNDHNGVIDDIDTNGDGVCDCLLIATLGVKGTAGVGDVFASWLSARSNNGATDLADQTLTPELLAPYNVIVAQDVQHNHPYSDAEVTALSDWVNHGGGFMALIGYGQATEIVNINGLLLPFAMSYGSQQILRRRAGASTIPITLWTPHPVDAGVTALGVDNGYPVLGSGTTFATSGSFDVGKAQEVGSGHVVVWGDEWITYNSEWQDHPDYQVQLFWLNAIKWLTVAGTCQVAIPPNPPK